MKYFSRAAIPFAVFSAIFFTPGKATALAIFPKPLAIVAPDGQRTTLALDANGYLASIADPAGNTATYTYDVLGLMATYTEGTA